VWRVSPSPPTRIPLSRTQPALPISGVRLEIFRVCFGHSYRFSPAQEVILGQARPYQFTVSERVYNISGRVLLGGAGLSGVQILGGQTTGRERELLALACCRYERTDSSQTGLQLQFQPASRRVVVPRMQRTRIRSGLAYWIGGSQDDAQSIHSDWHGKDSRPASSNLVDWASLYTNTAGSNSLIRLPLQRRSGSIGVSP